VAVSQTEINRQDSETKNGLEIRQLDQAAYHVLRDVTLDPTDSGDRIGLVLVSIYGIFVVSTLNAPGMIAGQAKQSMWTRQSPDGKEFDIPNPLQENARHIRELSDLLSLSESRFHSLVVFRPGVEFRTKMPSNVVGADYETYIGNQRTTHIADDEVQPIVEKLQVKTPSYRKAKSHWRYYGPAKDAPSILGEGPPVMPFQDNARGSVVSRVGIPQEHARLVYGALAAMLAVVVVAALFVYEKNPAPQPSATTPAGSAPANPAAAKAAPPPVQPEFVPSPPPEPPADLFLSLVPQPADQGQADSLESQSKGKSKQAIASLVKEDVWRRWYKPSKNCETVTNATLVQCATEHATARDEFERLYAAGKIR
jgi:hypothetical protein